MVARSATRNLGRQFIQQLGVSLRIDFAFQQARSALDRESADFARQAVARARSLARHFIAGLRHQALCFARSRTLGLLDDFVRTLAGLVDDLRRTIARFADDFLGALLRLVEILLALAGRGQSVGNFLLP